eukprot:TRINITY_DN1436_c1_g1_i1.p1 TRINITY_DN1436_c1_g1~~TRINITY_DN1436_c1_g1_i1.p1  ORF type:complete len:257 (-),score=59.41 TRINITY_DN1436_c1_g1_i1:164-934(-)
MKLAVLGAGLPRTGTASLRNALEILYPEGPCYHMFVFVREGDSADADHWNKALDGKTTKEDWYKFFDKGGFRCAVDYPAAFFYKELLEAYPDAKVVLTVRDPLAWHDSCYSTIFGEHKNEAMPWIYYLTGFAKRYVVPRRLGETLVPGFKMTLKEANQSGPQASEAYFEKWLSQVKEHVPSEQLLVFDVREGWEPLCGFLGKPIPDVPFPNSNSRASLKSDISKVKYFGWSATVGAIGLLGGLAYYFLHGRSFNAM